jgi:hypothetical protein
VFRLTANADSLLNFVEAVGNVLPTIRLAVVDSHAFSGVRVMWQSLTAMIKSQFACTVTAGSAAAAAAGVNGATVTVQSAHLVDALKQAIMKDAPLSLTVYAASTDRVTLEAVSATGDIESSVSCPQVVDDEPPVEDAQAELSFHTVLPMVELKQAAKRANASGSAKLLQFTVRQAVARDTEDDEEVTYSQLTLSHRGDVLSASRVFHSACTVQEVEGGGGDRVVKVRAFNLGEAARRALPWGAPHELTVHAERLALFLGCQKAASVELHLPSAATDDQVLLLHVRYGEATRHTLILAPLANISDDAADPAAAE